MTPHRTVPALGGLAVAWGGTLLLMSPAGRLLGPPGSTSTAVLNQLVLWLLFAMVLLIVTRWERLPLSSIGLRRFRWASPAWGLGLAAVTMLVVIPVMTAALRIAGIAGFEAGMAPLLAWPVGLRIFAVVTAGVVEDTLFLGYTFTRLSVLTRRSWLAGVLAGGSFCLLHLPGWGIGPVIVYFATVSIALSFFAWRCDLLANIVAHTVVDGMALVVMPALAAVH